MNTTQGKRSEKTSGCKITKGDATVQKGATNMKNNKRADNNEVGELIDIDNDNKFVKHRTPNRLKRNIDDLNKSTMINSMKEGEQSTVNTYYSLLLIL